MSGLDNTDDISIEEMQKIIRAFALRCQKVYGKIDGLELEDLEQESWIAVLEAR